MVRREPHRVHAVVDEPNPVRVHAVDLLEIGRRLLRKGQQNAPVVDVLSIH